MGAAQNGGLRLQFDRRLRLEFRGAKITTDAGLLAVRELDEMMGLTDMAGELIVEARTGTRTSSTRSADCSGNRSMRGWRATKIPTTTRGYPATLP